MIHTFKARRLLFAPVGFLNSVARWLLGVHSSDGSVEVRNTANPGDDGSVDLKVNVEAIFAQIAERMDTRSMTEDELRRVKAIVRGYLDGVSLTVKGEHVGIDLEWLRSQVENMMTSEAPQPTMPGSPTTLAGGYDAGGTSLDQTSGNLTAEGNGGFTLYVLSRAKANGVEKVMLFFRTVTVAEDGRIAAIGPEISAVNVYPG